MKRRDFVKTGAILTAGGLIVPLAACENTNQKQEEQDKQDSAQVAQNQEVTTNFKLPGLPYDYKTLEPYIDEKTMKIHHRKHHAGYVKKLNKALENHNWAGKNLDEICRNVSETDTAIRNNGGGHFNHSLFWESMQASSHTKPEGTLSQAIERDFGSFDGFRKEFFDAAATVFGSGWAWLSVTSDKKLFVSATPNQDNPLMGKLVEKSGTPILGIDVWEHAYYLKYQNRRKEYINNFFSLINWQKINQRLEKLG